MSTRPPGGRPPNKGGWLNRRAGQFGDAKKAAAEARKSFWNYGAGAQERAAAQGKSPTQQTGAAIRAGARNAKNQFKRVYNNSQFERKSSQARPTQDLRGASTGAKKLAGKGANLAAKAATGVDSNDLREIKQAAIAAKNPFSKEGRQARAKLGKKVLAKGAGYLTGTQGLSGLYERGLDIVTNKKFWIYTGAILFILFFMLFNSSTFDPDNQTQNNTPTTSDVCNPPSFPSEATAFNQISVCTITVTYTGSAQDITITDTTLPGTEYVSSSPKGDVTQELGAPGIHGIQQPTGNTIITWDAQKLGLPLNPVNITVTVKIRITTKTDNTIVYNAYDINPVGLTAGSGGGAIGGNVPANSSTCGGKYTLTSPLENFGDPQCNFTRQALDTQLNQADPGNAMTWDCIAYYESTDDPDAYNGNSTSGFGAYGLFQMNPPGKGNNQFDNGGVNWPVQTSNAINYNRGIGGSFLYWGTYYTNGGPCH